MSAHRLRFDTLDLVNVGGGGEPFWFETLAEGASFGAPQPVEVVLSSQVLDGSLTSRVRDDNRELSFVVCIKGADLAAVSAGERALDLACGKPTTLTWTPPDGFGKPTVYDVLTSSYEAVFDDLGELRNERTVRLRIAALPFGRSTTRVTDDAVAVDVDGGTIVDACESTAGWSTPGDTPPAVDTAIFNSGTGSVRMRSHDRYQGLNEYGHEITVWTNTDAHTLSVATGAGGYLSVLIRMDYPNQGGVRTSSNVETITMVTSATSAKGVEVPFVATEVLSNGFVRYSWIVPADVTITSLKFKISQRRGGHLSGFPDVRYDEFRLSSTPMSSKQYVKTIDVRGSARAPGSLHVSAPVGLGQLLLFTVPEAAVPSGFRPDVRRYITAGATTADSAAMSGSSLASTATFEVPVASLTEGAYMVVARAMSSASMSLTLTAQMKVGGNLLGPVTTISNTESVSGAARYVMFPVDTITLPVLPMQNPDNTAFVQIAKTAGAAIDEIWLCPLTGNLTIADLGVGTVSPSGASSNFWLDSASPTQPNGGWWKGASSDRTNSVSAVPNLIEPGDGHIFTPPRMLVYVASTNAVGPVVTTDYFPHAFGNVSE